MTDRIKKLLMSIAALAALAAGGAAYAGAQSSPATTSTATPAAAAESETGTAEDPADDPADKGEGTEQAGEHGDGDVNDSVTGDAAAKAKAAALAKVPGGTVGDISAEQADAAKGTDKPEAGDTPDPAYESKIAYDVEVTKTGGTQVNVHLDKAFQVLGVETEKADGKDDGENANN
jgi:hypothetical protein